MLKAVAARCFQTGYAIFLGTVLAVLPPMAAARVGDLALELPRVGLSELPWQGRGTHGLIRAGGSMDGTFDHRERILPARKRGYYREHTVKTQLSQDRGAQRIACTDIEPLTHGACDDTRDRYASFYYIIE